LHRKLASYSIEAHKRAAKGKFAEVKNIEKKIDRAAAKLWDLSAEELTGIKHSLGEA